MLEDVLYYQLELVKILFLKRAMPLYLLPFLNFYSFMLESFIIKNSLFLSYLCSIVQSCPTLWDPRLLCLWDSPSKNIGYVGSHSVLQGIFPRHQTLISYISCTGGWILSLSHQGSPSFWLSILNTAVVSWLLHVISSFPCCPFSVSSSNYWDWPPGLALWLSRGLFSIFLSELSWVCRGGCDGGGVAFMLVYFLVYFLKFIS